MYRGRLSEFQKAVCVRNLGWQRIWYIPVFVVGHCSVTNSISIRFARAAWLGEDKVLSKVFPQSAVSLPGEVSMMFSNRFSQRTTIPNGTRSNAPHPRLTSTLVNALADTESQVCP